MHTVPVRPFLGGARFSFVGVFHIKSGQICANLSNQLCRDIGNLSVTKGISAVMSSCSADSLQVLQAAGCRRPLQISFGGCGALCVYHTGVWKCIADNASHLLEEFEQLYGASAGAFTAVCAACKCDPVVVYEWIMEIFKNSREYCIAFGVVRPSFRLYSRMREFLERVLPWDAHKLCKNRVNISLSVVEGIRRFPRNWLLTDFTTRKELINVSHTIWHHLTLDQVDNVEDILCHMHNIFYVHVKLLRLVSNTALCCEISRVTLHSENHINLHNLPWYLLIII